MPYPKDRIPAKKTKCPHCDWTGSARGLFGHVRMKHPGLEESLNIRAENPYLIEKPKAVGSVKTRVHRKDLDVLVNLFMKLINEYRQMDDELFPSRSYKLTTHKSPRKKYE
jgi:hypothetical protein